MSIEISEHYAEKGKILLAYLLIILIPLLGIFVEVYLGKDLFFQRSGALLTCTSLIFVYINHFLEADTESLKASREKYSRLKQNPKDVSKKLPISELKSKLIEDNKNKLESLNRVKANIIKAEFSAGILGTLIWGFGDLLF